MSKLKEPQLVIIDTLQSIRALKEYLADKEYVAYDCETTGLTKRDEIIGFSVCAEDGKAFYVITQAWDKDAGRLRQLETHGEAAEIISVLKTKSLIMHNGTFDCMMAEAYWKISLIESLHTDTMILAHLLNENEKVGLKDLGERFFGATSSTEAVEMKASVIANGGQVTKANYEMYKADPYLMAKYGAKDALLTFKLFYQLVPDLYAQGLDQFFYQDESMPLLRGSTYDLNTSGLQVDTVALTKLKKTLEAECLADKDFIYAEIHEKIKDKYPATTKKNAFNIGASQQLSWLCYGVLGLEFAKLTDSGKALAKHFNIKTYTGPGKREFIATVERMQGQTWYDEHGSPKKIRSPWAYTACDKASLEKHAHKYKWIGRLLSYQKKTKILSTYIEGIEERLQYGVIHPSFLQHGTTSGRYSSRNPNFQNLPRDDKRVKDCVVARPGKVFVGADYSQLEPRVFAYFSGDERLIKSFANGDCFYSVIGMEVYEKYECVPKKEGAPNAFGLLYAKERQRSKVISLASTYGATAYQLAPVTGLSIEETDDVINSYFERFPGVRAMMLDSHEQAKTHGFVTSLFGRPRRIPQAKAIGRIYKNVPHEDLPYEARSLLNLAVNHRIQGTGASIMNRAAIAFHTACKDAGVACKLVLQVHDQLVAECDEKDGPKVAELMQIAMETATVLPGVKLEAVPKIGRTLGTV